MKVFDHAYVIGAGAFLLLGGLLACSPYRPPAEEPIIRKGVEGEIEALLIPHGFKEDLRPGWRFKSMRIERSQIRIKLARGQDEIIFLLRHRQSNRAAKYHSRHYSIYATASKNLPGTLKEKLVQDVVSLLKKNDKHAPWNRSALPIGRIVLWLVPSVLLLLLLSFLWFRASRCSCCTASSPARKGPVLLSLSTLSLMLLIFLAAAIFFLSAYLQYRNYQLFCFDFGIYSHGFWNAIQGNGFYNSPEGMDHLGSHASPILYLLLPFYALFPSPVTLLVLQALALASAAIPVYLLCHRNFSSLNALLITAAFLLNPFLTSLNHQFHAITFAMPLLLWAFHFLQDRKTTAFLITLVLAMSCKENVGLLAFFLGLYILLQPGRRYLGMVTALLGLIWLIVAIEIIIPSHLGGLGENTMTRFSHLGRSWWEILLSPILRPSAFWTTLFTAERGLYLLKLLLPFLFLPLLAPRELLILFPVLMQNLLSNHEPMISGSFHYEAMLLPVLFFAFLAALKKGQVLCEGLKKRRAPFFLFRRPKLVLSLFLTLLVFSLPAMHLFMGRGISLNIEEHPRGEEISALVKLVPQGESLVSPRYFQPHLSRRTISACLEDSKKPFHRFAYAIVPVNSQEPDSYEIYKRYLAHARFKVLHRTKHYALFKSSGN